MDVLLPSTAYSLRSAVFYCIRRRHGTTVRMRWHALVVSLSLFAAGAMAGCTVQGTTPTQPTATAPSTGYVYAYVDTAVFVDSPAYPGSPVTSLWKVQPVFQSTGTPPIEVDHVFLYGPFASRDALQAAVTVGQAGPPTWQDLLGQPGTSTRGNSWSEVTSTEKFALPSSLTPGPYDLVQVVTIRGSTSQQVRTDTPLMVAAR